MASGEFPARLSFRVRSWRAPVFGDDVRNMRQGRPDKLLSGRLVYACRVDILVNVLVLVKMTSRQLCRFLRRDLLDVLAPVFRASVHCEAGDQLFVMNLDPTRRSLLDENVDAGNPDIPLVEKDDISLSDRVGRENDRAIVLRGGVDDLRVSDHYGLERPIGGKNRYKIGPQDNSFCRFLRACGCRGHKNRRDEHPCELWAKLSDHVPTAPSDSTFSGHWAVLESFSQ
jgi:hypothetical protein